MTTKHTPGPWFLEKTKTALWVGPKKAFSEKVADVVVRVEYGPEYRESYCDTAEANARLIAAAPELLEALNDCVAVLTDPVVGTVKHDDPDWYLALDRAVAKARAAVAKAGA